MRFQKGQMAILQKDHELKGVTSMVLKQDEVAILTPIRLDLGIVVTH